MKKHIAILLICITLLTSFASVGTSAAVIDAKPGYAIELNGEAINCSSIYLNNTHYVPLRNVFEKMGAVVFYRASDNQILALSRDGDMIRHIVGKNVVNVNGKDITFKNPSVRQNNTTYIPLNMVYSVFYPKAIQNSNQRINIQKQFANNEYHKIVKDILDLSKDSNFYPENFKKYKEYHTKAPNVSMKDVLFRVNLGLDRPFYENIIAITNPYDKLVLVNKYNKLPDGHQQINLVNMERKYTSADGKQYLLESEAYQKYTEMATAAKNAGQSMIVVSAYRTESYQRNLYNNKVYSTGKANADNYSARPGHSEHQTGLAVDINSTRGAIEYTQEFKWLQQHAHEYGFIMRYPKGKEWITGYAYEPWHYRYVGIDAAKIIHDENITYEEYYVKYIIGNEFK